MKQIAVVLTFLIFIGCQVHPRYRKGGEERPGVVENLDKTRTTEDKLKFGLILQSYLGKPYKGTSKYDPGLDCSSFTGEVFRKYNKTILPRTAKEQYKEGKEVHYHYLKYGDLVFFKTDGRTVSHVGIYIGENRFIHASSSRGVIISSMREKYWADCYFGARRVIK